VIDVAIPEFERHVLLPKLPKAGKPVLLQEPLAESPLRRGRSSTTSRAKIRSR
jgi:hypothetical protein